tara:strand:+ start:324 stop:1331 length:1008 start_codon:yes stop_codon:yes gene_type:complete
LGGLARKATVIENLINNNKNPIIVDAGDLYFKKNTIDPGVALDVAMVNADIITQSFNAMGCDAFSPGSKDFAAGVDFLFQQYEKSNFAYVSCNIYDLNDELLFEPYVIKEIKGKKIGIIGLSSIFESKELIIKDPIITLEKNINKIENSVDFVLLLFNASQADLNLLYNKNLPIDMILSSKGRTRSSDGGSKIPTYMAGDKGKILYQFEINLVDDSLPIVDIAWCENTINRINDRLDKMKQGQENVDLYQLYKNDKKTINRIKNYQNQIDRANQLLENAINSLTYEKIELNKTIYDRLDILQIVDKGKLEIKEIGGPMMDSHGRLPGDPHHGHNH